MHCPRVFILIIPRPPTSTLFPYTTLFRSGPIRWGQGDRHSKTERLRSLLAVGDRNFACFRGRSEEHTSELQSRRDLVCRLLLEKKKAVRSLGDTRNPPSPHTFICLRPERD